MTDQINWHEAEIVAEAIKTKDLTEPRTLVRRRCGNVSGSRGEEILYLPGPAVISLFTGAGGFDLGIEQAGFCTVVQHEWGKEPCETLMANRPRCFRHAALIQGDIRTTPTSMLLEHGNLRVGEAHLLIGGPPCQGFSTSNSNRGKTNDQRNDLVFEYLRVVRESQPRFFCFENVPGFMELNKGAYFEAFLEAGYGAYYELVYGLIDCSEYGVPQRRVRFICQGTRRDIADIDGTIATLPKPHCFGKKDLRLIQTVESAPLFTAEYDKLTHAPGIRYFPDRPVLRPPRPTNWTNDDGGSRRSREFIEFYDRLEHEEPDRIVRVA